MGTSTAGVHALYVCPRQSVGPVLVKNCGRKVKTFHTVSLYHCKTTRFQPTTSHMLVILPYLRYHLSTRWPQI